MHHIPGEAKQGVHSVKPSNEYVLNVAFFSFVSFLILQAVFAIIAHSQSMLADCEAMGVDALTYLFNLLAERLSTELPPKMNYVTLLQFVLISLNFVD